ADRKQQVALVATEQDLVANRRGTQELAQLVAPVVGQDLDPVAAPVQLVGEHHDLTLCSTPQQRVDEEQHLLAPGCGLQRTNPPSVTRGPYRPSSATRPRDRSAPPGRRSVRGHER